MERICRQFRLLTEERGVVRVPFLVKGRLILSPEMGREEVESAFSEADRDTRYLKLPQAQLIREPIIDREAMQVTPEYLDQVMPPLNPLDLVETDIDKLVLGPYALAVDDLVAFTQAVGDGLEQNWVTVERVRQLCGQTMEHPEIYLDGAFAALRSGFDPQTARRMIDRELAIWNLPGKPVPGGLGQSPGGGPSRPGAATGPVAGGMVEEPLVCPLAQ